MNQNVFEKFLIFDLAWIFTRYEYGAEVRPRFGVSLGLLVDCLNTFSVPGHLSTIKIRYPGPDMQLLQKVRCFISIAYM